MKLLLLLPLFYSFLATAANEKQPLAQPLPEVNVSNEIKLIQQNTIANERVFKVIDVKSDSTFKELGYKKGDIVKKINNETIFNQNQLKAALNKQATDWENTSFDNDFSEGELDFEDKTFEELESTF